MLKPTPFGQSRCFDDEPGVGMACCLREVGIMDHHHYSLFPTEPVYPPGFRYFPGFVTMDEERFLLEEIGKTDLHHLVFQGFEAKRKVTGFGYHYHFDTRSISKGPAIPKALMPIIEKAGQQLSIDPKDLAQVLITEYPVGSVINWHRDAPPFDMIVGISLLSDCVFKFRPYDKAKQNRLAVISIPLERRSMYIMAGEARQDWEHSISPVKTTRYSITLRTLRR